MVLIINQFVIISIHALREEGDNDGHPAGARPEDFYPRPPRGGRRQRRPLHSMRMVFLSTPSARRATCSADRHSSHKGFLSTPSARRATLDALVLIGTAEISIHALREEGDHAGINTERLSWIFLSTPSARRATK